MLSAISSKAKLFIIIVVALAVTGTVTTIHNFYGKQGKPAQTNQAESKTQSGSSQPPAPAPLPEQPSQPTPTNNILEEKYQLAYQSFGDKKYANAIKTADEILKQDPNFYKAYNIKGIALSYSSQPNQGLINIDKALAIKPDFAYARFNKALAYELTAQYDKALEWYDKALQVENYIWSYYGKASIYGRRGDVANTVKFLKIAIDMDPGVKDIAKAEHDFDPVKNSREFINLLK